MPNDATEAALGLLGLHASSSSSVARSPPVSTVPLKRKQSSSAFQPPKPPEPEYVSSTNDSITCICGFAFDDGFSIACDSCARWCHAACFNIVAGNVPDEWQCWICDPRPVDKDRAVKLQKLRLRAAHAPAHQGLSDKDREKSKRRISPGVDRKPRSKATALAVEDGGNAKRKRRSSITVNHPSTVAAAAEDEQINIDIDEPWTHSYVPIAHDIVPQTETKDRLRSVASHWRGVTALHPSPTTPVFLSPDDGPAQISLHPLTKASFSHPALSANVNPAILPPSYAVHAAQHIPSSDFITPYTSTIIPSRAYLADPLNAYAHLGMPKPFVHLFGPPLDVALDARIAGGRGRFVRSGCRPNAVLRPVLCDRAGDHEPMSFGVFAMRDLKANEEVVLGWEWDDGSVVHHLPALIETPHKFPPHQIKHFRHQMMSMLHALSSTFTTCACGARAKDCALTRMAEFVDGQTPPTPSPSPPSLAGDEHPYAKRERERGGKKKDSAKPLDLGPLIGVQRGFRTRERIPHSGGMYGVEMVPNAPELHLRSVSSGESTTRDRKGKRKASAEDMEVDIGSALNAHDSDDSANEFAKHHRRHTVTSAYPSPVLSVSSPVASKHILPPVDVLEENMPPKMRKSWIHKSSEALRDSFARSESRSRTTSSSGTPSVGASEADPIIRRRERDTMDVDEEIADAKKMPPPPLPHTRSPIQTLAPLTTNPRSSPRADGPVSPSIPFANLSLLSPVIPGRPSRPGMSSSPSSSFPHQEGPEHNRASQSPKLRDERTLVPVQERLEPREASRRPPGRTIRWDRLPDEPLPHDPVPCTLAPSPIDKHVALPAHGHQDSIAMTVDMPATSAPESVPDVVDDQHQGPGNESIVATEKIDRPPTPPRPVTPPPPKVKLSLKDFAMRKKKQREEETVKAAAAPPVAPEVPPPPESANSAQMDVVREESAVDDSREAMPAVSAPPDKPPELVQHREDPPAADDPSVGLVKSPPHADDRFAALDSLRAKVELVETSLPESFVKPIDDYRTDVLLQPEPPPPQSPEHVKTIVDHPRRPFSPPPSRTNGRKPYVARDAQEDGEITSPPPQQKPPLAPRSHTPPTHPRSFHDHSLARSGASPPLAMSPPVRRPLQPTPYRAHLPNHSHNHSQSNGHGQHPRPLPSGPRALRAAPRYSHPVPRGPSADRERDRERADWERDRSWMNSSSRGRGRGGGGSWGR